MTTNANSDGSSSQTPTPDPNKKFSLDAFFHGLGVVLFIICWIVAGVVIFFALTGMGIFTVFAVFGGIIGGFVAAVVIFIMGMAGI